VEAYAVLGGMPAYLAQFDGTLDVFENIARHVLRREAFLYDEPRFVLLQELREPRVYFSILRALSLVERHVPITEGVPEKSRKGLYQICDLFFRFWFRFVYPHATNLEAGRSEVVLQQRIRPAFNTFVGPVFEEVCRQWLRRVEGTPAWRVRHRALGRWWDREHEIDLVGLGERGEVLFGECKWSEKPVGIDVLEALRATSRLVPVEAKPEQTVYVLFSKSGFTEAVKRQEGSNVRLVGLQEIGAS
jgi:AAA+ ATPase superfamily predicted ATPase